MTLKLIALLFAAVLVLTRLPLFLWPKAAKAFWQKNVFGRSDKALQAAGIVFLLLALLFFYSIFGVLSIEQVIAVVFSAGLLIGSFMLLRPRFARAVWKEVLATSDGTVRLLAGLAVLVGLAILYFLTTS